MTTLRESDLRSLERRSMYSIFAPLDTGERLPRELMLESKRHRQVGRRELAGLVWLPALWVSLLVTAWSGAAPVVALAVVLVLLAGLVVFAISGGRAGD